MKRILFSLGVTIASLPALGQSLDLPVVKAGDRWTYRVTEEGQNTWSQASHEVVVQRATPSTIYFSVGQVGAEVGPAEVFMGADWTYGMRRKCGDGSSPSRNPITTMACAIPARRLSWKPAS